MYVNTLGLVLRENRYKESSKMLTVLTAAEGKISVSARGAMRKGSKIAAAAQLLALSDMTLLNTNGRWVLTEARSVEQFRGLRDDVEKLALGSYFSELLETVSDEDSPDPAILTLGLNAVYALSESVKPDRLVKAAFELRLMCLAGFAPQLGACSVCGKTGEVMALDLIGGTVICSDCAGRGGDETAPLDPGSLEALRHICTCPPKKLLSFQLGSAAEEKLCAAAEKYTLRQLDRGFKTLDFYKSLRLY